MHIRSRKIDSHEKNGGAPCDGMSTDQKSCTIKNCPSGMTAKRFMVRICRNKTTSKIIENMYRNLLY